jgi:hypothetical protein
MPFVTVKNGIIQSIKMEFNLNLHCNYSCAECSRNSPHLRPRFASLAKFKKDVRALEKVYHVQRFRFEGGEPLLNRQILAFIQVVRDSVLADRLHVHTNGALLQHADESLFRELDILSISRYPVSRLDDTMLNRTRDLCERYGTQLRIEPIRGFRRINLDEKMDLELTRRVFASCQIAHSWYCQTFFNGWFYLCSRPLCTGAYRRQKGLAAPDYALTDGIPIHCEGLFARMRDYLARRHPLGCCSHCLGSVGRHEPWRWLAAAQCRRPPVCRESANELIDQRRLWFLYRWDRLQLRILRRCPSLKLARFLGMLRDVPFYRSRSQPPPRTG